MGAFNMQKYFPTLASQHIKFLKPATTAVTVELRLSEEQMAKMEKDASETGKAKFELEVELKDENDEVVAIVTGKYQMRSHAKPNP